MRLDTYNNKKHAGQNNGRIQNKQRRKQSKNRLQKLAGRNLYQLFFKIADMNFEDYNGKCRYYSKTSIRNEVKVCAILMFNRYYIYGIEIENYMFEHKKMIVK